MNHVRTVVGGGLLASLGAGLLWAGLALVNQPAISANPSTTSQADTLVAGAVDALGALAQTQVDNQLVGGAGEDPPISTPASE